MQRVRIGLILASLVTVLSGTVASTRAAPLFALALPEGRTHDQAHDTGHIDWSGPAQYVYIRHRDGASLPSEEGGAFCGSGCWEWVTRLGNGGMASGSFDRDVSYFEVMVGFTPDPNSGSATLRACASVKTWPLKTGSGLAGFVSMNLAVPAGCRTWSLTASGGYADFRSLDVYYAGPPNTPTPTRTPTATFTPSFTPTATATFTPSPTPTPLPPQITGEVVCDLWGEAGWCRGDESLELTASDPLGFDVTITGELNGEPFTCGSSCDLPLPEGMGIANYTVTSTSGQTASGSSTWQRDGTPPELEIIPPGVDGRNGWHVSEVKLSAVATDAISGLSSLAGSLDGGGSWVSFPIQFTDGGHQVLIHARDVAGNENVVSRSIRVDTVPPLAQITSHSDGGMVQGSAQLTGTLEDGMSGPAEGKISVDGGATWQAVSLNAGNDWSYVWGSNEVPNGEYTLQMQGMDQAGNVGEVVSVKLTVDNATPTVSITERWWIWETGQLKVAPNHFPIESLEVTIRDPQNRWPALMMELKPGKPSYPVIWVRRFGDGTLAPSGEYLALAVACDVNGLCGRDMGRIVIPTMATLTDTLTPSPTVTNTLTPLDTPIPTQIPPSATPVWAPPIPEKTPEPSSSSFPLWQVIGLLGMFMAIASASVVDPRPKALERLSETIKSISALVEEDSFNNNRN